MTKKERIAQLENEVAELKARIMRLEAQTWKDLDTHQHPHKTPGFPLKPIPVTWTVESPIWDPRYLT